ncbi:MAG TPA: hypothetical protein VHW01_18845 [Polyangiaceae bacterium]|nr:hypothetical protein [Polyangiaceae bacterium]
MFEFKPSTLRRGLRHCSRASATIALAAGLGIGLAPVPASAAAEEPPSYALSWTHGEGITGCASLREVASQPRPSTTNPCN